MGTLTIRKVPDEVINTLKETAARHNRSTEAEVRSVLEDFTATYAARAITTTTDLVAEMERLLEEEGLDDGEELTPDRHTYDTAPRPVDLG